MSQITRRIALFSCVTLAVAVLSNIAQAQTYSVLYALTQPCGGPFAFGGVTLDQGGKMYGTTYYGGAHDGGAVYRLSHEGDGWVCDLLYSFGYQDQDGSNPYAGVVIGPDGLIYGTTGDYGSYGHGTVFSLRPPASRSCGTVQCSWIETTLYNFTGGATTQGGQGACAYLYQYLYDGCGTVFQLRPSAVPAPLSRPWVDNLIYGFTGGGDGAIPSGDIVFDKAGNLYGTTAYGGLDSCGISSYFCGVVYQFIAVKHGWQENVVYSFTGGSDGDEPSGGVIFDRAGNLYGTSGPVFKLAPSGIGWSENSISLGDGWTGLIFDTAGNLYGSSYQTGEVFELTLSENGWIYTLLYQLDGGSRAPLSMDADGNLYGTQFDDGAYGHGTVFKLTRGSGGWTYTSLHDFTSGSDWGYPLSNVIVDAAGNLYGTSESGVWEITP